MNDLTKKAHAAAQYLEMNGCWHLSKIIKEEILSFCALCESPDISEVADVSYCEDCQSVEGGYMHLTEAEAEEKGLI